VAAVLAWVILVSAAINFGQDAAAGGGAAGWAGTVLAGIGATLCLLAAFVLLGRLWGSGGSWRSSAGSHRR
jgi:protein-S-isoprenylcysteine O-methyltransferase Ste14